MKLYCFYTPSHTELFEEWFEPSILKEYELHAFSYNKQLCPSATYRQRGWRETQVQKVSCWIQAIEENMGEIIVCSDVDAQFFGPTKRTLKKLMHKKDILFQLDTPHESNSLICSGFFVCRCNATTLHFFKIILRGLEMHIFEGEQDGMTVLLGSLPRFTKRRPDLDRIKNTGNNRISPQNICKKMRWYTLPCHQFWSPMSEYTHVNSIHIPYFSLLFHHANWTIGIENKISQLKFVQKAVEASKTELENLSWWQKTQKINNDREEFFRYVKWLEGKSAKERIGGMQRSYKAP